MDQMGHQAIERGPGIVAGWPEAPTSRPRPDDHPTHRPAVMRIVESWSDVTASITSDHEAHFCTLLCANVTRHGIRLIRALRL